MFGTETANVAFNEMARDDIDTMNFLREKAQKKDLQRL